MGESFRSPNGIWWIIIAFALTINFLAWYNPHVLDTPLLPWIGPWAAYIGRRYHRFTTFTNILALAAHVGEALFAFHLCRKTSMGNLDTSQWVVQTFLLGFPSLRLLLGYSDDDLKRRKKEAENKLLEDAKVAELVAQQVDTEPDDEFRILETAQ